jgi:hypothetical protein
MHFTPTGLPSGIPGTGDEIDNAIQQAPQPFRHSIMQDKSKKIKVEKVEEVEVVEGV